jgi:hypothetical protein
MPVNYPCYGCTELIDPVTDAFVDHGFDCDMWMYYVKFHGECYKRFREREAQKRAAEKPLSFWPFW